MLPRRLPAALRLATAIEICRDDRTFRLKTPAARGAFGWNPRSKSFPELAVEALQRKVQLLAAARQPTNEFGRNALQAIYA